MSQHLSSAIASISHEIDRLTVIRTLLTNMNSESDSIDASTSVTKRAAKKAAPAKRQGRPPVSEETRQKMADARRAFFLRKNAPAKKTATKKVAAKQVKTAAKKTVAKKAAGKKSAGKKAAATRNAEAGQS